MSIYFLPALVPALYVLAAAIAHSRTGRSAAAAFRLVEGLAVAAWVVAFISMFIVAQQGSGNSPLIGVAGIGFSVRLDVLSVVMLALVSFIAWVVLRFTATYLDGEQRQGMFVAYLCLTLAAVCLLVLSGNVGMLLVAWISTSLALHRLLLFYPERVAARRAARKKFVTARIGDAALLAAIVMLVMAYDTSDIAIMLAHARSGAGGAWAFGAALCLALSAALKTAQFPTHGWLTEVMEAPTPVSALLHAGVINAGGFLLIRFADVMVLAPSVLALLALLGGFTALFGGLVMLTQPAIKTSLAWSTVAQMGFMILECGLALFPLALLHIVAHSLYKAHSFLAAGGAVESIAANRRPGPVAIPRAGAVARAFLLAFAIYALVGLAFGFQHKSAQAIALGAILIFGVAYMLAQGLADAAPRVLTRRTMQYAVATSVSYFGLQVLAVKLTASLLPATPPPGPLQWTVMVLALISFGVVAVVQAMFPLWAYHPAAAGLRVHLSNGFYANALFDRLLGGWRLRHVR